MRTTTALPRATTALPSAHAYAAARDALTDADELLEQIEYAVEQLAEKITLEDFGRVCQFTSSARIFTDSMARRVKVLEQATHDMHDLLPNLGTA